MIWERATLTITAGQESAFEAGVAEAVPHFRAARGCRSMALHRSIENPQSYLLLVGWDSLDDHMVHFRQSEGFTEWRRLVSPHFASPPVVEHTAEVLAGF
ncbi:MAG: antibiotic biosynthesis monooxygenase family protein [Microvirga sp.]